MEYQFRIGSEKKLFEFTDSDGKKRYEYVDFTYILSPYDVRLWCDPTSEEPDGIWRFDDENLPVMSFYNPEKIFLI